MISGAMAGVLKYADSKEQDEHVLVLGFTDDVEPLVIGEDGEVRVATRHYELFLDWRFEKGRWMTLEEIEASKGETGEEEPDAGSEEDGPAD
jgi:hypothetical protein